MRTQFAESCAHAKESLKNYKPENSLLGDYCTEGEEIMYAYIFTYTYLTLYLFMFRDVEKNQKDFSEKVTS